MTYAFATITQKAYLGTFEDMTISAITAYIEEKIPEFEKTIYLAMPLPTTTELMKLVVWYSKQLSNNYLL